MSKRMTDHKIILETLGNICFKPANHGKPIMEICPNGRFIYKGEEIDDIHEIYKHVAKFFKTALIDPNFVENQKNRIRELEAKLDAVKPLLQEIMDIHADPKEAEYNECDTDPCQWCDEVKAAIGEQP